MENFIEVKLDNGSKAFIDAKNITYFSDDAHESAIIHFTDSSTLKVNETTAEIIAKIESL